MGRGPNSRAIVLMMAAPVGVTSSPFIWLVYTGMPVRSSAVAGAGTGRTPWLELTKPYPKVQRRRNNFWNTQFLQTDCCTDDIYDSVEHRQLHENGDYLVQLDEFLLLPHPRKKKLPLRFPSQMPTDRFLLSSQVSRSSRAHGSPRSARAFDLNLALQPRESRNPRFEGLPDFPKKP